MEKIKVNVYPEGLKFLAENMDLPFPKEETAIREGYVLGIIDFIAGL